MFRWHTSVGGGWRHWARVGLALCAVLITLGAIATWELGVPVRRASGSPVRVHIAAGESVQQIGADLQAAGVLRSQYWFRVWVWLSGREAKLVAGEYYLPPQANIISLVRLLSGGITPTCEVSLRLLEGWTWRQMQGYLTRAGAPVAGQFTAYVTTPKSFAAATSGLEAGLFEGKPAKASLEGYLFPDTYRVFCDATVGDLVRKMLVNLGAQFPPAWRTQLKGRGYNPYQGLTLASIVEKEVPGDLDRAMVADIFWRRLVAGQGLEADSTVNYVTGKSTPSLSAADLAINSPYNTYRHRGLPPGPISNPGQSAIRAVVYPQANQYWYFLTTSEGRVIYSKTFAEHQRAKAKYLR